jgi:AbrB family looped-hinge helix DNA binding protein
MEVDAMQVKVSPKYQVTIPVGVRERLGLRSGQKLQVIIYKNRIELIPERDIEEMRGFLKGMSSEVQRENDRL